MYTAVYGFNTAKAHKGLWQELENLSNTIEISWLVATDFNNIRTGSEKARGKQVPTSVLSLFNCAIEAADLFEVPNMGGDFFT